MQILMSKALKQKNTEKYVQKANEIVAEHVTEVEEMQKLDRGTGDYSRVPVAHIKMIIFFFFALI